MNLGKWLDEGDYTLGMSSGFFGFFAHAGVLDQLCQSGHRPSRVSGSSAGSLIAGCYAAGLDPKDIRAELFRIQRSDFWDPSLGLGLLKGQKFDNLLRSLIGDIKFEQTRIPLTISVFDITKRQTIVLSQGDVASAIRASCALPILFQPVSRNGQLLLDGGIGDRPGRAGVDPKSRTLYHHLLPKRIWRKLASKPVTIPKRPELRPLVISGLPKVGPHALQKGKSAYDIAFAATDAALRAISQ